MSNQQSIQDKTKEQALKKRNRIGVTILKENKEILDSLKKAHDEIADVIIYSDHEIEGFETMIFAKEEEIGRAIVRDYKEGKIDQFVRGQVDDFGVVDEFKIQFGIDKDEQRVTTALIEDIKGNQFFLSIASNPEGQSVEDRIRIIDGTCDFMKNEFGIDPKVAVMATCRPGTVGKDPVMTESYEGAEKIVKHLEERDIEAKNIHIELQNAVPWANLVAAANGTIGNQIFRALVLLGGGKAILLPTIFPGKGMYEDNSRNEQDWYNHVVFASALANKNL